MADTLADNTDNKPGYADFSGPDNNMATARLVLSNGLEQDGATATFHYSQADPNDVKQTSIDGSTLRQYDPGSTGALRLWNATDIQLRPASVLNGGDFIPDNVAIPVSKLNIRDGYLTLNLQGINLTDPSSTEITVDIDDGTGHIVYDAVRVTVASMKIIYTDVSGLSHDDASGSILPVPRIPQSAEPDGVAADWMNGVDDGSTLLVRVAGSPALATLWANAPSGSITVTDGEIGTDGNYQSISAHDGYIHYPGDGFVSDALGRLEDLGIEGPGEALTTIPGITDMTVLSQAFYRPPNEFDLDNPANPINQRNVPLAIQVSIGDTVLAEGAKPAGVILTRPPLVLVHGMNSSPGVWFDKSGGTSFVDSVKNQYAGIYEVDHSGKDPARQQEGVTYGTGELTDMYVKVADTVAEATNDYRTGMYFSTSPDAMPDPDINEWGGALIAVQKVDVVAHSYGGLLTRWYVEQSAEYAQRRDVRKIIELGTPNLGSPFANMVDEIYRNPTIANAQTEYALLNVYHPGMKALVSELDLLSTVLHMFGPPSWQPGTLGPRPFYEDDSVGSALLQQLSSNPFNDDIGYGAVIGTDRYYETGLPLPPDLYKAFQPIDPNSPTNVSYFPWLYQFDSGPEATVAGGTDSIVPTWSAALGVAAYNHHVDADHVQLVQNADVQATALQWLNDPNLPLGTAQRAAESTAGTLQAPISERNAYQGASGLDANGRLTGGGLNPNAIVGVSFSGSGMKPVTWDTVDPKHLGIQIPILTGMIRIGDIGSATFQICAAKVDGEDVLDSLGILPLTALNIAPDQMSGASLDDWVAFTVTKGMVGRRHDQELTGPSGDGQYEGFDQAISYQMPDLPGGKSPSTQISLPELSLPAPSPGNWHPISPPINGDGHYLNLTLSGAVESSGVGPGTQLVTTDLYYDYTPFDALVKEKDTLIPRPNQAWVGLLIPYTINFTIFEKSNGYLDVFGPTGVGIMFPVEFYQYLRERKGVPNAKSPLTEQWGSSHV